MTSVKGIPTISTDKSPAEFRATLELLFDDNKNLLKALDGCEKKLGKSRTKRRAESAMAAAEYLVMQGGSGVTSQSVKAALEGFGGWRRGVSCKKRWNNATKAQRWAMVARATVDIADETVEDYDNEIDFEIEDFSKSLSEFGSYIIHLSYLAKELPRGIVRPFEKTRRLLLDRETKMTRTEMNEFTEHLKSTYSGSERLMDALAYNEALSVRESDHRLTTAYFYYRISNNPDPDILAALLVSSVFEGEVEQSPLLEDVELSRQNLKDHEVEETRRKLKDIFGKEYNTIMKPYGKWRTHQSAFKAFGYDFYQVYKDEPTDIEYNDRISDLARNLEDLKGADSRAQTVVLTQIAKGFRHGHLWEDHPRLMRQYRIFSNIVSKHLVKADPAIREQFFYDKSLYFPTRTL